MDKQQGEPKQPKGLSSKAARKEIRQQLIRRLKLQKWASVRVKPWPRELRVEDYDFRSWATGATKNCLIAGGVYEYARESRKLRGLLLLLNPNRLREPWEMVRPGLVGGKAPDPESPFAQAMPLPCSYRGLNEHCAERALGGFLYCLSDLADYLADNISFGELFRSKQDELEKAFGGLDELSRVKGAFRYFLRVQAKPKKRSRLDTPRSALDALSAMRLASYVRKISAARARELALYLSGEVCGFEFEASAIGLFEIVRLGGRGKPIAESNFDALIVEARDLFQREFPFGEKATNAATVAERMMTKSKQVSS
jgi:hypothetical protein